MIEYVLGYFIFYEVEKGRDDGGGNEGRKAGNEGELRQETTNEEKEQKRKRENRK